MKKPQHIHFIGICGVAMSALALAFKRTGYTVTGSDVGFYPPISTHLKDAGVDFYPGWHPERILQNFNGKENDPSNYIVVVGNVASSTNPEWLYVQKHKLNYKSYPEVIKEFFVRENSIVVAGTYGKTTSSALLTWILKGAGLDPNYMFGGLMNASSRGASVGSDVRPLAEAKRSGQVAISNSTEKNEIPTSAPMGLPRDDEGMPSAALSTTKWSILEGDEYKSSKWDNGAKFFYYAPTHLLLTSIVWDHADVYPTEESYFEAFKKLIGMVPKNDVKVISEQATAIVIPNVSTSVISNSDSHWSEKSLSNQQPTDISAPPMKLKTARGQLPHDDNFITYGRSVQNTFSYSNLTHSPSGIAFDISHANQTYHLTSTCIGDYMADNITGCFALALSIGITAEKIISAVKTFPGMKRRLEKRFTGQVTVFDDIAHSPTKAKSTLESLRAVCPTQKIIAVFEPNTGNRRPQAIPWYDNAFQDADIVFIPELTKVKKNPTETDPIEAKELSEIIAKTHSCVRYINDDEKIIADIIKELSAGDVVVFLGSHGFRGMIENLVKKLSS